MGDVASEAKLDKLPDELLDHILEFFAPYYAKPFTIDKRSSLSVQSEDSDRANDIRSASGTQTGTTAPVPEERVEVSGNMSQWVRYSTPVLASSLLTEIAFQVTSLQKLCQDRASS
jgi:hypothetical protein